jgi:hypothetical protein
MPAEPLVSASELTQWAQRAKPGDSLTYISGRGWSVAIARAQLEEQNREPAADPSKPPSQKLADLVRTANQALALSESGMVYLTQGRELIETADGYVQEYSYRATRSHVRYVQAMLREAARW